MNRIFQPSADALLFRMSDGAERCQIRKGTFKVICQGKEERMFPSLLEAFLFYMTLDEAADLLHVNKGTTLIERKVQLCLN